MGVGAWPDGFHAAFVAHQKERGRAGFSLEPVCREAATGLQLCLTLTEGETRRPVTLADLQAWDETPTAAFDRATERARAGLAQGLERQSTEGVPGAWFLRSRGDGLDAAALLVPDLLAAHAGGPVVVAVPARGSVLFWTPGVEALDQVMAVGVRRTAEAADQPVSDRLYRWTGERWVEWGRAEAGAKAAP